MHVRVVTMPSGLAFAYTGRERPEGMRISYCSEVKVDTDDWGVVTASFEIPDKDTDGPKGAKSC